MFCQQPCRRVSFLSKIPSNNPYAAYTMIKIYNMRMMLQRVRQHLFLYPLMHNAITDIYVAKYSVLCNAKYK